MNDEEILKIIEIVVKNDVDMAFTRLQHFFNEKELQELIMMDNYYRMTINGTSHEV